MTERLFGSGSAAKLHIPGAYSPIFFRSTSSFRCPQSYLSNIGASELRTLHTILWLYRENAFGCADCLSKLDGRWRIQTGSLALYFLTLRSIRRTMGLLHSMGCGVDSYHDADHYARTGNGGTFPR